MWIYELTLDTETGPGVYETALAYTDALRMADNALLFKFAAKSVGMKHGIIPSFMAKPWGKVRSHSLLLTVWCLSLLSFLDVVGEISLCAYRHRFPSETATHRHIHVSLRDADGKSLFAVSQSELESGRKGATYSDTKHISQLAEWFLAGILVGLPDGISPFLIRDPC